VTRPPPGEKAKAPGARVRSPASAVTQFRSSAALVAWRAWLLFAAANLIDLAVQGRIGWATVTGADPAELLRVGCAWPDGAATRQRSVYVWAVHSPRRRRLAAELRAERQSRRADGAFAARGFGQPTAVPGPDPDPLRVDAGRVVAALTELGGRARRDAPSVVAAAPESSFSWLALGAVILPGLALALAALL